MTFYYDDLNITNETSNWFIPLVIFMIFSIPILIWVGQINIALAISIIIALIQIIAIIKNCMRLPL